MNPGPCHTEHICAKSAADRQTERAPATEMTNRIKDVCAIFEASYIGVVWPPSDLSTDDWDSRKQIVTLATQLVSTDSAAPTDSAFPQRSHGTVDRTIRP